MPGPLTTLAISLRQCGFWGTVYHMLCPDRWRRAQRAALDATIQEFDRPFNVDTAGEIPIDQLEVESENRVFAYRYQAVFPGEFRQMMQAAGDVATGRVFLDLGCGKGRALLLASEYPFDRIVGVDLAAQLIDTAKMNALAYRNPQQVCRNIEAIVGDAAVYPIPNDPLVLFLYSPFGALIMERVIDNVRRSLERKPRPFTLMYINPKCRELWDAVPSLEKTATMWRSPTCNGYAIYHYHG